MTSTISAFLTLSGRIADFKECSDAIGLRPTDTWTKAVLSELLPEHSWSIGFEKERGLESLDDAVSQLLQLVTGHEDRIKRYAATRHLRVTVTCTVMIFDEHPVYELTDERVRAIADLGAGLLLDVLDYSDA